SEDLTLYGGYVLGWDSGFDDNGDSFLGGISAQLTCDWNFTYATVVGRFGEARWQGVETGYMHSIVNQYTLCEDLLYVSQSDYLRTDDGAGVLNRETYGWNNYLIKTINDCWGVGTRFEWWATRSQANAAAGRSHIYALTAGVNYRPHANLIVRPEFRWDWDDDRVAGLEDGDDSQTTFAVDTILTF
ncbi:MAG: outer membrane beta-barrel protein, partial [Planctomycetota bacterium]